MNSRSMSDFGSELGADLGPGWRLRGQEGGVQDRDDGPRTEPGSFPQRTIPAVLQSCPEAGAHGRAYMTVDAMHSRHLMTHPFAPNDAH